MRIIKASELRKGMTIVERSGQVKIETITPCTQPRKLHVNGSSCYDYIGTVSIK